MKKFISSRVFVVIIIAIICITEAAYASSQLLASDIGYTKQDGTDITVMLL